MQNHPESCCIQDAVPGEAAATACSSEPSTTTGTSALQISCSACFGESSDCDSRPLP